MTTDGMIAALLRERAGYERMGQYDRAAQVTEQLKLRGYDDGEPEPATEPPKRRGRPPKANTEDAG